MTCIYNPDNQTRALLKNYEDILGSYEAAYYVLALNNGYPLEMTPDGKKSDLWLSLTATMSREDAVRKKAMTYTKAFFDAVGDWTMGLSDPTLLDLNGEPRLDIVNGTVDPRISDILNNHFLRDDLNDTLDVANYQTDPTDLDNAGVALLKILSSSYDKYVEDLLKKNTDKSLIGIRRARRNASHEWYKRKVKQIVQEQQLTLAKAFGLEFITNNDGSIELRAPEEYDNGTDKEIKLLRIKFVLNLNYDPLEDERRSIFGEMPLHSKYNETDVHHQMHVADAVSDANHMDMFTAKNGLMYVSLNNGTCATINKVLAYHYIMTYYDSKLILSAINSIVDDKNASMMYKVNYLVDYLTEVGVQDATGSSILDKFYANNKNLTTDNVAQAEFFNKFWQEFDELNDQVINKGINSKSARNKILSTLAAAIITNNKLTNEMAIDHEIPRDYYFRYMPSSKEKLRLQQSAYEGLLDTLRLNYINRVEHSKKTATVYVDLQQVARILMLLHDVLNYNSENIGDVRLAITKFYETGCVEIAEALDKLLQIISAHNVMDSAKVLSVVFSDTIGFYKNIALKIHTILTEHPNNIITPDIDRLRDMFNKDIMQLETNYNNMLSSVCFDVVDKYVDLYIGDDILTPFEKQQYKKSCHSWLTNQAIHGDIAAYETTITMNSYSGSDIVRLVYDAIRNMDKRRDQIVREKSEELFRVLYNVKKHLILHGKPLTALLGNNFQRVYQELDENGKPTGFFTRRLNYGKFYKRRRSFINSTIQQIVEHIRKDIGDTKFNLEYDDRHNPIFPSDPFYDKYWRDYLLLLNEFDCKYGNKQYTEEYYRIRLNTLSRKTIDAVRDIEERIDLILGPITKDGIPHPEQLDRSDLIELILLQTLQESLYSRYYPSGEYKNGDDLKISEELRKFRDLVKDGREYESDDFRYSEVLKKVPQKDRAAFEQLMSHLQLSNQFWDVYNKLKEEYRALFPPACDAIFKRMDEINKERRELTLYSSTGEYNTANLENLSEGAFLKIKDLDIEFKDLSDLLNVYKSQLGNNVKPSPAELLANFDLYETHPGSGKTVFEKFIDDAKALDQEQYRLTGIPTTENVRRALDLYTIPYVASDGSIQRAPTSAFSFMTHSNFIKDEVINRFGLDINNLLVRKPNKVFNKLVGGRFMNTEFDLTSMERLLPKEKNPLYDVIENNRALKHLYNLMVETMSEANAMIPNSRNNSNYRLPLIGASTATMLSRGDIYNPLPGILYGLDRAFNVNETDTEINEDFYTLPDGTRINHIPLRFILMLEDPTTITADVVGSVILYYNMAVNFKLRSEAAPILELIKQKISKNTTVSGVNILGTLTNQYSKLENVLESRLYDKDAVWGRSSKRLSTSQKRGFKIAKTTTNMLVKAALSRNFISYTTGFWDASSRFFINSILGDSFNTRNWFRGVSTMTGYLADGQLLAGIGSHFPTTNASMLMSYLGIAVGTASYFKDSNKNRMRRSLKEVKSGMAGFRVSDYMITGGLTVAICDNYRYYLNPDGSGTFLLEREWINRYLVQNPNNTHRQASKAYQKSLAFVDAFDYDRVVPIYGNIYQARLKDKYSNISEKELIRIKTNISKTVENLAAKFNGAVPNSDKAVLHQNPILRVLSTLRNYLINDFLTRWEYGESFLDDDTSNRSLKALLAKLNGLISAKKLNKKLIKNKDRLKAIDEIDAELQKLNDLLNNTMNNSVMFNRKYWTDGIKAFLMGIPTGAFVGSFTDFGLSLLVPSAHNYVFALSALGTGISFATYLMYKNYVNGEYIKIDKKLSISDKIAALEIMKHKILSQEDDDLLDAEIETMKKELWRRRNLHNMRKGIYNYELRHKSYGYNRAFGSALITLTRKLKFFFMQKFAKSWKDLSDIDLIKYTPKLSQIEKTGVRRVLGDMSMIMLWMMLSCIMFGWRNDDPENVLPAKIADKAINLVSDNDHFTRDILANAYNTADDAVSAVWDVLLNNEPVQNTAEWLYDKVTHGNTMPRDNNLFERMIEAKLNMVLGKKLSVSSKTGEAKYSNEANYKQFLELTKAYSALQTVRVFTELEQPYDPTSINDMLSTTSATNNVGFKMIEQGVQETVDEANGVAGKLVQRSVYTGFEKSQYHAAKSIFKPTGIPTLFEETSTPGLDSRLRYSTNLGFNSIIFQKEDKKVKPKLSSGKKSKKSKFKMR